MRRITENDVLTIENKEQILRELQQEVLLDLFKGKATKQPYKPIAPRKVALDQQLSLSISVEEKNFLRNELLAIQAAGHRMSLASYIRNKSLTLIDINKWYDEALIALKNITSEDYDEQRLRKRRREIILALDKISLVDDTEDYASEQLAMSMYEEQLREIDKKIALTKKGKPRRRYRVSGRVTFNEANIIRWRAARLSLTLSDYVRFVVFNYEPGSFADTYLSVNARKRFYISVLDVYKNGWGEPPQVNDCPHCIRYLEDIEILKRQIANYQKLEQARRV